MIKYDNKKDRWIKTSVIILILFVIFWIGMNLSLVFGNPTISNFESLISDRYQNCAKMLGMIVPIVYSMAFYFMFTLDDAHIIMRYGKKRYEKYESRKIVLFSIVFAFEYMAVDVLFMDIFVGVDALVLHSYYLFMFVRFIMFICYLSLIGMTQFFLRNLLDFNKLYAVAGALVYVLLAALYLFMMKPISPVFYMNFSEKWFNDNIFDSLTYIINLAKLVLSALIFMYLGEIAFMKRDIMGNEED